MRYHLLQANQNHVRIWLYFIYSICLFDSAESHRIVVYIDSFAILSTQSVKSFGSLESNNQQKNTVQARKFSL